MFFRGIHSLNLDVKGRLALPKRYRDAIAEESESQLIITIDWHSPCLLIYSLPEWEMIERKLMSLPNVDTHTRQVQRLLLGHASEVDMDAQGRVLVPALLRPHAGLEKQAILLGQGNKFELWSQQTWDAQRQDMLEQVQQVDAHNGALANLSL